AGRAAGADSRDRALTDRDLAPLRERGIPIRQRSRWFRAVSAVLTETQAAELRADPRVLSVRPVARLKRDRDGEAGDESEAGSGRAAARRDPRTTDPRALTGADYGAAWEQLEALGVPEMHKLGYSGRGVLVALFDTGFYKTHSSLSELDLVAERDFLCGDGNVQHTEGDECGTRNADNHGTYAWSALGGFAPGIHIGAAYRASFALARTEDVDREVHLEEDHYIAALEWADSLGADIVSTSLGYRVFDDGTYTPEQLDGATIPISIAASIAVERGILVVTAMGNSGAGTSTLIAPADGIGVAAIGATDFAGNVASFSSRGPTGDGRTKPDLLAHGVYTSCATASTPQAFSRVGGTSLATPLVAGLAALLLEAHPDWDPETLLAALRAAGDRAASISNTHGWGVPDGVAAHGAGGARLRIAGARWSDATGEEVFPDWGDSARIAVRIRNDGSASSPEGSIRMSDPTSLLVFPDTSAFALARLAPGESDSLVIPVMIPDGSGFALSHLFLSIRTGEKTVVRKARLPITSPYALRRFDAEIDAAGAVRIEWKVDPGAEIPPGTSFSYRILREGEDGIRVPIHDAALDWWVDEIADRPPGEGRFLYFLEVIFAAGLYVRQEGPRTIEIGTPVETALEQPFPNPILLRQGRTLAIPVAWAREGTPAVGIYDPLGRRIRTLRGDDPGPGYSLIRWDMKDDRNRAVPAGVYQIRLPGGKSARAVVVR
ncbi:MAG: hypothetical protein FJY88_11400, partial [Candidatus Eisenbacteria bacterium]|nr:hypothetical protein [Candidatus Eisenbacteria bacterium]